MLRVRCSLLPTISLCPAAAHAPTRQIARTTSVTNEGTATHAYMLGDGDARSFGWVNGAEPSIPELAAVYNCDADKLAVLCAQARKVWIALRKHFQAPCCEAELAYPDDNHGIALTGHIDVQSRIDHDVFRFADFKCGWKDRNYLPQMMGYALLGVLDSGAGWAIGTRIDVRKGEWFTWEWSRKALLDWWHRLAMKIRGTSTEYPGEEQCRYCPRWHECHAIFERTILALAWFSSSERMERMENFTRSEILPEDWLNIYERIRQAKAGIALAEDLLHTKLSHSDDKQQIAASGQGLKLTPQERREVNYARADGALREAIGAAELAECVTIGIDRLKKAIAKTVERGKGKRIEEVFQQLDAIGAIDRRTIEVIERVTVPVGEGACRKTQG